MEALAAALETGALGAWARGSGLAYPVANTLHLFGLVLLVGAIGLLDLRLLGAFRALPLATLSAALTPLGLAGLAVCALTGAVLFAADARALVTNPAFLWKGGLIAIALANALLFRACWRGGEPRVPLRAMALASLVLWLAVATLGRFIAYV
ncbi:hypothetical protein [Thermaurantiacus sp.]